MSSPPAPIADYEMETTTIIQPMGSPQPHVTYITQSSESSPIKIPASPDSPTGQNKQKHPQNMPYDPFIHTNNKPPLSFSSLIFLAIEDAKEKALPVKEIYSWIIQHYPYFKTAPTGWKNSVRHNLSLNKCFQKVEKAPVTIPKAPDTRHFRSRASPLTYSFHCRIWARARCGESSNSTNRI